MKNGYPEKTLGDYICMCFGCDWEQRPCLFLVVGKHNMMISQESVKGMVGWYIV